MRKIRIGNDLAVQWSLVAKGTGEPFVVEGKDILLSLKSIFAKTAINEFDVAGNTISWTFKGAEQKQVGIYSLEVSLLDEQGVMITTDVCDFVELVACSCEIGGMDATGVHTESIELVSDVDVAAGIDLSKYLTKTEAQTTYQPQEKGKGLSTNDYTTAEKNKLAGLQNYDDTEIRNELTELSQEKEDKTNKVTSLTEESTDEQYPSAKAVYALSERISENEILIEDLQNTKIDKEADDYYPQLSVGLADNLAGVDVVDSEVNFRRSSGGAISDGVARIEAIKGNSVVWNQQSSSETLGNGVNLMPLPLGATIVEGNKYLILCDLECSLYLYYNKGEGNKSVTSIYNKSSLFFTSSVSCTSNGKHSEEGGLWWYLTVAIDAPFHARLIDLTKAFPNDWQNINTIEEFYARLPMGVDLNAYNEGEVIHMDVQSIESQGVNAWDEEWVVNKEHIESKNYIRVLPNKEYHTNVPLFNGVTFYDENFKNVAKKLYPSHNSVFITPHEAYYMKFAVRDAYGTTYNHDICINISDTSINGKYFPYIKRVEDLSIIRNYFPNGMKSAGSAHDEIRYNKESGKWEKVVRIGEVDMGTLNWAKSGIYTNGYYVIPLSGAKPIQYPLCRLYSAVDVSSQQDKSIYVSINGGKAQLFVIDSAYTDVASFKAAMSGVMLYYELAEPIVTELDAEDQFKDLDYQVWNCGTEKAIAEGKSAPLAADITYGFNAIGKIKELESLVAALRAKVGI